MNAQAGRAETAARRSSASPWTTAACADAALTRQPGRQETSATACTVRETRNSPSRRMNAPSASTPSMFAAADNRSMMVSTPSSGAVKGGRGTDGVGVRSGDNTGSAHRRVVLPPRRCRRRRSLGVAHFAEVARRYNSARNSLTACASCAAAHALRPTSRTVCARRCGPAGYQPFVALRGDDGTRARRAVRHDERGYCQGGRRRNNNRYERRRGCAPIAHG